MYSYLALGDSYTIGELVPMKENFPHQTVDLLRQRHVDVAEPVIIATTGWTTDELAASIAEHNITDTFSVVTLLIGVNNQYRGRSADNYKVELEQLMNQAIAFAHGNTRHVFVLSIPDWGATPYAEGRDRVQIAREIDEYNAIKATMAKDKGCHYLEITESTRKHGMLPEWMAEDGLHPSGKEYALWAGQLADAIEQELKR
ncbi:MAG: SGNH/GDSL hydrolase family protein [Chitinophagia bacterium]|nr:SGNH/GDSL hydrolase family protein [Chitinophagia bacterium]